MNTWLVTGASGFLGSNLGHWLAGKATRVGVARTPGGASGFDLMVPIDLQDRVAVSTAIKSIRPDVVVHAAAFAEHRGCEEDPVRAQAVNVDAAGWVAEAAAAVGARLLHISTDAVFDGQRGNYRETDQPNPFSVYGETKLLGEEAVVAAHPQALVVRTNFFGWSPSGNRSILEFFVNALSDRSRVSGFTDFLVTSLYAQDLASVLFHLAQVPITGVIHAAASDALSKYEFGQEVARVFRLRAELITPVASSVGPDGISRTRDISLNTDHIASVLGHAMPTQSEGIRRAYSDQRLRAALAQ